MKKWTADELLARHDEIRDRVCERYGAQLYFLLVNVLNVSMIEGLVESKGYATERKTTSYDAYSKIKRDGKVIGIIECRVGWPTIEILKFRGNKKVAKDLATLDRVIEPIRGYHRILDWHEVEGKMQKLAGGQIILNLLSHEMPDDLCDQLLGDNIISMIKDRDYGTEDHKELT